MKFLVDECLPHSLIRDLASYGLPDSIHPIHVGALGFRDDQIAAHAFAEDRIVITANAQDYKRIAAGISLHPGIILIAQLDRQRAWELIRLALAFLALHPNPAAYMINRVIEVSVDGGIVPYELARGGGV